MSRLAKRRYVPIMFFSLKNRTPSTLRLLDLRPYEIIVARCECGRIVEFRHGTFQRLRRVSSTTLVWDLQFRLRCKRCGRREGFTISIADERGRGDGTMAKTERVIVGKAR